MSGGIISIHALLAESDHCPHDCPGCPAWYFYPRSPCGERRIGSRQCIGGRQFLSTLSLRRATHQECSGSQHPRDFYPRSPCGERRGSVAGNWQPATFLSTLSLRRATISAGRESDTKEFLSTLSLRRATIQHSFLYSLSQFLSTLSLRRATSSGLLKTQNQERFLSTLSLRRATRLEFCDTAQHTYFYPRSPCGERLFLRCCYSFKLFISIHALLAESDTWARGSRVTYVEFLSTLSLRRATRLWTILYSCPGNFYPRSPCGERLRDYTFDKSKKSFLSTLSLRRATLGLPAGQPSTPYFYPRSPCGERPSL